VEHAAEFQVRHALLDFLQIGLNRKHRRIVAFGARHLEQLAGVREAGADRGQAADRGFEGLLFLAELLGALLVAPDARLGERLLDFVQPFLLALEVKDTSAARRTGRTGP
jgi:hypothetical protein